MLDLYSEYNHPYYCADNNHYNYTEYEEFKDWESFFNEYGDSDVDQNLIFRWDIENHESCVDDEIHFSLLLFMIQQRKGIFRPIKVIKIDRDDQEKINHYLSKHWSRLIDIWNPISRLKGERHE
jgi:hypothetical protein